jgi:hypothetical protein
MTDIYTNDEPQWEPPGIGAIDRLRYHAEAGQDESVPGVSTRLVQLRPGEIIAALDEIAARERAAREKALREAADLVDAMILDMKPKRSNKEWRAVEMALKRAADAIWQVREDV